MVFVRRRRGGARKGFRPRGKTPAKSLTKLQKQEVKKLVAQPLETKYTADWTKYISGGTLASLIAFPVNNSIVSGGASTMAWNLIPASYQAVTTGGAGQVVSAGNLRVGNKISDITIRNDFQFYINPALSNYPTVDATVKLFIVRAKQLKNNYNVTSLPVGGLLDSGNGASVDWPNSSPNDSKMAEMFPVNREQFTVVKTYSFRIAKNQDAQTGGVGAGCSPNMDSAHARTISHTYKHKSNFIYPDENLYTGSIYPPLPNNFSYMAFCVVYDTNTGTLPASSVLVNSRSHMWFKDA